MFDEDFLHFLVPGVDRLVALAGMLARRGLEYSVLPMAGSRHILVRLGEGRPRLVLVAHYDRAPGSPGYLDNSAACLALADFGARLKSKDSDLRTPRADRPCPGLCLLFTDAEENPAESGALSQGSFTLARGILAALGLAGTRIERPIPKREGHGGQGRNPRRSVEEALPGGLPVFLVLDVVGRGDRLLLSTAPVSLLARGGHGRGGLALRIDGLSTLVDAAARSSGLSAPLRLPLPWSDDLGLVLGGLPAVALSLLPAQEAEAWASRVMARGPFEPCPQRSEAGSAWPATWSLLHTAGDGVELARPGPLALVSDFLDALASPGIFDAEF